MLPDTFFGAVILSVVNMMIVFFVLAILAAIIKLSHTVVSKLGLDGDATPAEPSKARAAQPMPPARLSSSPAKTHD